MVRKANAICSTLIPLNFAAMIFKLILWLAIVMLPLQISVYAVAILLQLISGLIDDPNNVLAILLFALIGVAALVVVVLSDIRRLKGRRVTNVMKENENNNDCNLPETYL